MQSRLSAMYVQIKSVLTQCGIKLPIISLYIYVVSICNSIHRRGKTCIRSVGINTRHYDRQSIDSSVKHTTAIRSRQGTSKRMRLH